MKPHDNRNLIKSKVKKDDEYCTKLDDIVRELKHYESYLYNKNIYCNCDTADSNFVKYFENNYNIKSYKFSSSDYRLPENIKTLKECDVVVTNPPFSSWVEYLETILKYEKDFILIGNINATTSTFVFNLIQGKIMYRGVNCVFEFERGDGSTKRSPGMWFNSITEKPKPYSFQTEYQNETYELVDDSDILYVPETKKIPDNYYGKMAVPLWYFTKHDNKTFDLLDVFSPKVNGKTKYKN